MAGRVYIACCEHERESFGECESLCEPLQATFYTCILSIHTFTFDQTLLMKLYKYVHSWASIFYFFYKIRL